MIVGYALIIENEWFIFAEWFESKRWHKVALYALFLFNPLFAQTRWCSRILSGNLFRVYSMYSALINTNERTHTKIGCRTRQFVCEMQTNKKFKIETDSKAGCFECWINCLLQYIWNQFRYIISFNGKGDVDLLFTHRCCFKLNVYWAEYIINKSLWIIILFLKNSSARLLLGVQIIMDLRKRQWIDFRFWYSGTKLLKCMHWIIHVSFLKSPVSCVLSKWLAISNIKKRNLHIGFWLLGETNSTVRTILTRNNFSVFNVLLTKQMSSNEKIAV